MASEMAEFLWNKFLKAFEEAKSELPSGIISCFTAVKQVMETPNRKKQICSSADSSVLSLLHRLNDAISKCRVFAQQMNSPTKNSIRFNNLTEFFFVKKMKKELVKIKDELDEIKTGFQNLNIGTQETNGEEQTTKTDGGGQTSDPHRTEEGNASIRIFGFDEHKVKLEEKLLEDDGGFKAIGIYGMGGSGKSTLARQIYNSENVRSEFATRSWVSLSDTVDSNEAEIGIKVVKLVLKATL